MPCPAGRPPCRPGSFPPPARAFSAPRAWLTALSASPPTSCARPAAKRLPPCSNRLRAGSAALIEWLTDHHALPFELVDDFNYPGHSALRMHGLPSRTGRELIDRLRHAAEQREIVILNRNRCRPAVRRGPLN